MDKHSNLDTLESPNASNEIVENFKFETKKKSRDGLKLCLKKLNYLCLEFDPFNADELTIEEENILNEYRLRETIKNPFEFTNIILQMLDIVEAEQKNKLQ